MAYADKFLKHVWYRSRPKLFDTQMVLLNEFYEKVGIEKITRRQKACKITQ